MCWVFQLGISPKLRRTTFIFLDQNEKSTPWMCTLMWASPMACLYIFWNSFLWKLLLQQYSLWNDDELWTCCQPQWIAIQDDLCYCSLGICVNRLYFTTQMTEKNRTAMCYASPSVVNCSTPSLCYLWDRSIGDHHRNPNINPEIIEMVNSPAPVNPEWCESSF